MVLFNQIEMAIINDTASVFPLRCRESSPIDPRFSRLQF